MTPFIACAACSCHVAPDDRECPHCGAPMKSNAGSPVKTAAAIVLGLSTAIVACGEPGEAYGAPGGGFEGGGGSSSEGGGGGDGGAATGGAPEGGGGAAAGGATAGGGGAGGAN